jgi:hypothetical protein
MSKLTEFTSVPSFNKLVEVVKIYINRFDEDTVDAVPFFINAAEKTILRNLRMPSMEKIVSFTLKGSSESPEEGWVSMPYDYLEMKHVWIKGCTLQRVPFDQVIDRDSVMNPRGGFQHYMEITRPVWSITADRLYIRGVDVNEEVLMTYYADVPEVSEITQSNVLLDLVPDAFVFLAVAEGFRFLMEEQKADYWESKGKQRLLQVMEQVEEAEFSGSPLTIQYTY